MYVITDEKCVELLKEKIPEISVEDQAVQSREGHAFIKISIDKLAFNFKVEVASFLYGTDKVLKHVCEPLSDDILEVGEAILIEYNDDDLRRFTVKFLISLFTFFKENQLNSIEIRNFRTKDARRNFVFSGATMEFDHFSQMQRRLGLVDQRVRTSPNYREDEVIGSSLNSTQQVYDFSTLIGHKSMQNRTAGNVTGLDNTTNLFDKFSNALVVTDSMSNPLLESMQSYDQHTPLEDSFVRSVFALDRLNLDSLDKKLVKVLKKHEVNTLIITEIRPLGEERVSVEEKLNIIELLKKLIFYILCNCPKFNVAIMMEYRLDSHSVLEIATCAHRTSTMLFGPSKCGILSPGNFSTGNITPTRMGDIHERGNVALITRDVSMMNKVIDLVHNNSHGVYEAVVLGTTEIDTGLSSSIADNVYRFACNNSVHMIIIIESFDEKPPSNDLDAIIAMQKDDIINKPVIAWFSDREQHQQLLRNDFLVPPCLDPEVLQPFIHNIYLQLNNHINHEVFTNIKILEEHMRSVGIDVDQVDDDGNETVIEQFRNAARDAIA